MYIALISINNITGHSIRFFTFFPMPRLCARRRPLPQPLVFKLIKRKHLRRLLILIIRHKTYPHGRVIIHYRRTRGEEQDFFLAYPLGP
jgi:hypothetical protein